MNFVLSSNSSARTGISSSKHELSRNEFARLDLASCFALGLITGGPVTIQEERQAFQAMPLYNVSDTARAYDGDDDAGFFIVCVWTALVYTVYTAGTVYTVYTGSPYIW